MNKYNLSVKESDIHAITLEVLENTTDKKLLLDIIQTATDSYLQQGGSVRALNIRLRNMKTPIEAFDLSVEVQEKESEAVAS